MKKIIIIAVIVIILLLGIYWFIRKKNALTSLQYDVGDIDLQVRSINDLVKMSYSDKEIVLPLIISNFSKDKFKIDSLYIELYDLNNQLIAYQKQPVSNIIIEPEKNTEIQLPIILKSNFIWAIAKQLQIDDINDLWNEIKRYLQTGELGTQIKVKGYFLKAGLKFNFEFLKQI